MKKVQMEYILDRFFYGWKVDSYVFDKNDRIQNVWCEDRQKQIENLKGHTLEIMPEDLKALFLTIKDKCIGKKVPLLYMEQEGIYFMAFQDCEENSYIFGPVSVEPLSFAQLIAYRKRYHIVTTNFIVPRVSFSRALTGLAMVYYMITGNTVTEDEIMKGNQLKQVEDIPETMIYEIQELSEEKRHLAYRDEAKWTLEIENGTMRNSKERMTPENMEKVEKIGTLANSNSLKQYEYMAVTSTCLASRAAIRGGVNAYEAYALSEKFLQKISLCTDVMEMLQIHMQIADEFSKRVRIAKENRSVDCVQECKDYMERHRREKFSLKDVAREVGKSPGYLSRVFSEQIGMTMQEYALNLRLEAAANILCYSNESIGMIAEYLSFPSQSYFGERFKKKYGMTPNEYRKQNKIRDFKE